MALHKDDQAINTCGVCNEIHGLRKGDSKFEPQCLRRAAGQLGFAFCSSSCREHNIPIAVFQDDSSRVRGAAK